MVISIIGAGNGGQAIAGYLANIGHEVILFDINKEKVAQLQSLGCIRLEGRLQGLGVLSCITSDWSTAVQGAELIMVTTVANAHESVAKNIAPFLQNGQIIILNPGRTCGALVFRQAINNTGCTKRIYLAEAQTLVYACRIIKNGCVNIIGVKDEVLLSALPASDTDFIIEKINTMFHCFQKAENVLRTSLENIGAMFHPCVLLFNAATIERNEIFWFYRDMTEQVASFIEKIDKERLAVGNAYGVKLLSVSNWIKYAYNDTQGDTLCERMRNNPAYHDIKSPSTIFTRQLMEDIPTGVIPILELGEAAGIRTPLLRSMVNICEALLGVDMHTSGRTLLNLGLEGLSASEIIKTITEG